MEQDFIELNELKSNYQLLKEKVDKQEIINDRLLRETMRNRMSDIKRITIIDTICGAIVLMISPMTFHYNPLMNLSWWFVGGTDIMMLVCIFFNWKYNSKMCSMNLANCDLLEFQRQAKKIKKAWEDWIKWAILMLIIWVGWMLIELYTTTKDPRIAVSMSNSIILGVIIGGLIGYKMNRKVVHSCDDIIKQIENI